MEAEELRNLVRAAKKGDSAAFGRLYEAHAGELYRFALWYLHNETQAEDAVQDAMLNAWRNLAALRKEEAFRPWMFKILANACKTICRKDSRLTLVPLETDPEANALLAPAAFENDPVGSLLSSLAPVDRTIVTMAVLGDFKSAEIAEALDMKSGAVRSRLSRALHALRTQLETEGVTA